jgi:hypothetical protein
MSVRRDVIRTANACAQGHAQFDNRRRKLHLSICYRKAGWGLPSLPQDVINELARRAKLAERLERQARAAAEQKKPQPVRVRVAHQPTFTPYVFEVPDETTAASGRNDQNRY